MEGEWWYQCGEIDGRVWELGSWSGEWGARGGSVLGC